MMNPFHLVRLAGDALDRAAAASSTTCTATAAAKTTRSSAPAGPRQAGAHLLTAMQTQRVGAVICWRPLARLGWREAAIVRW